MVNSNFLFKFRIESLGEVFWIRRFNLRWLFPELNIFKPPPSVSVAESFISCLLHLVSTPPEAVGCPESTVVFCYFLIALKSF